MLSPRALTLISFIAAAAASRLIPHPPNFTAMGAICLFGGAYFTRRWAALLVPMAALLISDAVLAVTLYGGGGFSVTSMHYVWFALIVLIGMTLRGRVGFGRVLGTSLASSVLFFLASNFHAWLTGYGYPLTPAGLLACYAAALPFAWTTVLGDLFFCGILFGGFELISARWPALRTPAFVTAPIADRRL